MGVEDYWDWIALAADLGILALFYKLHKDRSKQQNEIKNVPTFNVGPKLIDHVMTEKALPYVCVEGYVAADHKEDILKSRYSSELGVIRHSIMTEHKSKRQSGYWTDIRRTIKDYIDKIPFRLQNRDQPEYYVRVTEPLEASYAEDELKVTYDKYEQNQSGLLSKGIDRIFGEVTKGYQEKEKMLTVGTYLLGIGRVGVEDGNLILEPPLNGEKYVLTRLTKKELLKDMSSGTKGLKICCYLFGCVAAGIAVYMFIKRYQNWRQRRDEELLMDEVRTIARERENRVANGDDNDDTEINDAEACTVCLTNPRNVVLLNCGHICCCADCASVLPRPKKCPMCRVRIERIIPVYRP